jgi:tape measure domain-containing protein
MAKNATRLAIEVDIENLSGLNQLKSALRGVGTQAANAENDLKGFTDKIVGHAKATGNSINSLESQKRAFEALRRSVDTTSDEFKRATAEVAKLDKQLARTEGRRGPAAGGGTLSNIAKGVGGVAAAGIFGGPEGLIGAALGAPFGPVGLALGAGLGASAGALRKQASALTENVAAFNRYKIALAGVSSSQEDYNSSIEAARRFSVQFVTPINTVVEQYTKLKASVIGAGLSSEETNKAFAGLSAAVKATGGDQEDLNSALRAASQVFSKGKVSAEELRQQIGERLPGAFTIFADSMGISTKQLDKLLEQGKVELKDFVAFTEELMGRYGATSEEIAKAPELAGARLQVALQDMLIAYGGFFVRVGAGIQDYLTKLANFVTKNKEKFIEIAANIGAASEIIFTKVKGVAIGIAGFFGAAFEFIRTKLDLLLRDFAPLISLLKALGKFVLSVPAGEPSFEERRSAIRTQLQGLFAEFTPDEFGLGLRDSLLSLVGGDLGGGGAASKRIPASQRLVDLTKQLADAQGKYGASELATLKYMVARQKILDNNTLPATDRQVRLNELLVKFKKQALRIEEREAAQANKRAREDFKKRYGFALDPEGGAFGLGQLAFDPESAGLIPGKFEGEINTLQESLKELIDPLNQINGAAQAIGEAFSSSFTAAIDGSVSAQQALADFFRNVGSYFLDMAGQIIQKMIQMAILNSLAGLLPSSGGFGGFGGLSNGSFFSGGGGALDFSNNFSSGFGFSFTAAKGGAFDGGLVKKPTMFAYANGGTGNFGLMGESGPEAILPLRRTSGGKLGVEASGGMGNVVVNVDASGTNVQGDDRQASQLGRLIGAAVQSELVKQKRPGGLLAG